MEDTSSNSDTPQQTNMERYQKDPSLKGVVGLQNMGNTCYSNSTLQLIRACSDWNGYCITQNFTELLQNLPDTNNHKRILLAYQDIVKALWSTHKPAYIRPMGFISEIRKAVSGTVYEMFGMPIPNDSHEYLVYLLDNFHEALKKEVPFNEKLLNDNMNSTDKMITLAENGWNRFISKNNSEIVNLFFGMMRKTIHCTNCKNNSYQWEVFNSLKIPCEGNTFEEWIINEVKESEIEDYKCDKCKDSHLAKIYSAIWKLPQNLFVTLRRFNFDGRKNMTQCPYDGEQINFKQFFAEESNDASREWSYELHGISDHHGSHMGGHYTAQFKHPISGEWWLFDDETAHKLEKPHIVSSNYIYYFRSVRI